MRPALPLFLILSAVLPLGLRAKDPSNVDATKQNEQLAPTPANADTPLAPSREANQRTFFKNDHVQEQRFSVPDQIERKDAAVGDRRAPIDMKEKREKTIIDRKDYPKPEVREHQQYARDGEKARIQPSGDQVKEYDKVTKFQGRMTDASAASTQREVKLEKRTTFDKLNRFIFRRNGPGSDSGKPVVTTAGGERPPSQDTYTKYKVNWERVEPPVK